MKKIDIVHRVLKERIESKPTEDESIAFAPTNIALCKYWGKRNQELNLPFTSSLSISLGKKGATTRLSVIDRRHDLIMLNDKIVDASSSFSKRLVEFLNLFRQHSHVAFQIKIESNIPIAAGLASSACGFASVVNALNYVYAWKLPASDLSILARLGSGSACRSIWQGFVEWHAGVQEDGMDSFGEPIPTAWPELCTGLLVLSQTEKSISSREAMQRTVSTSPLYSAWPDKVKNDLALLKEAIHTHQFPLLGSIAESNAMAMHATMLSAWPSIMYYLPDTITFIQKIWRLRAEGLPLYFTQDAGPNLKLLFLKKDAQHVLAQFPEMEMIK